jgi:integrase
VRWYVYAWRGGPAIHKQDDRRPVVTPELLDAAMQARRASRRPSPETVAALIVDYRASPEFTRLTPATKTDYRRWLDRIESKFGRASLGAFEDRRMRGPILNWRDQWAATARAADMGAGVLRTLLAWGVDHGRLTVNLAARIKPLHRADRSDLVWEDRHWQALEDAPSHLLDALQLGRLTGLRLGDLLALDWSCVGESAIVLVTAKRKGRAVIPALPELRTLLDGLGDGERKGPVLRNSRGAPWTADGFKTVFQRAKPEGFDRRIHDLRGTYVTWLATKGLTDDEIARTAGWTSKRVAGIRARYVDEARVVVSMVERLSA